MNRHRQKLPSGWLAVVALWAALSVGCGASGGADNPGPNTDADGGGGEAAFEGAGGQGGTGVPTVDAGPSGVADNPIEQLFANPQRSPLDFLGTDAASTDGYADAARACYASPDPCGASECGAFASCCVNTGICCKPIDDRPLPAVLDFQVCAGPTVGDCTEGATTVTFGPLAPVINARGLVPNGTATAEGGAAIGDLVNLSSERVQIDVRFSLPIGCGGTCLESAGVAFTAKQPGAFVDAGVGLLLSGSRHVVSLMIGDAVADSFDAGTDSTQWRMILSPDGSAQVIRDGVSQGTYSFDAAALDSAQFVAFGRNLSAEPNSAAIAVIEFEASFCDNPKSWSERKPVSITLAGDQVPGHASGRRPSIVDQGARTLMAYEVGGEIFVSEEAPGEFFLSGPSPALVPTEPFEAQGVGDPELVWDGNFLLLFYTARDETGAGRIAMAMSTESAPVFMKSNAASLVPDGDVVSYDAPSVHYRDGLWLLAVRATLASGATELRAFYTSDPETDWARVINGGLELLTRVESPTSEVTDPSLIIHNSAYHLYYGRRTGTRWSVELAVSDELLLWRPMGNVLGDSDVDFDRLGARSPDAISRPDRIDVVYAGQDGVSFRLGTASRPAPAETAPSIF